MKRQEDGGRGAAEAWTQNFAQVVQMEPSLHCAIS